MENTKISISLDKDSISKLDKMVAFNSKSGMKLDRSKALRILISKSKISFKERKEVSEE